mmetsp:Transcript_6625/g.9465  ORF Transcript_6625/g.9465 Transcript_6625/m.9465 type:complete len:200 (+) Transcript_6625:105-704(+)
MLCRLLSLVFLLTSVDGFGTVSSVKKIGAEALREESANIRFGRKRTTLCVSEDNADVDNDGDQDITAEATVRIDDGGSDLTDRFKYKVNALMGTYDPTNGVDDENQDGNIFNAMLNFPAEHTFNVVGKTNGEDDIRDAFVEDVKKMVSSLSGEEKVDCRVTPRGNNYTRVKVQVSVESATMINTITTELNDMELTVMSF